jgi:hypothetical protein
VLERESFDENLKITEEYKLDENNEQTNEYLGETGEFNVE